MRTHPHVLPVAGLLVALPFVPPGRTLAATPSRQPSVCCAASPLGTGAAVSSKLWVQSELLPSAVLPVMTGGMISSKPWLANAAALRGASEEPVTLGAQVSSKPWLPNQWDRPHVEFGPLEQPPQ
jgi:hypothetical protein